MAFPNWLGEHLKVLRLEVTLMIKTTQVISALRPKVFVSDADLADINILVAKKAQGISPFLVDKNDPGVQVSALLTTD